MTALRAGYFEKHETWGNRPTTLNRPPETRWRVHGCRYRILRLSLLGITPVPVPSAHDEFSYLLAGDTFAHGRLTNPTHPMWVFLDTIHVNQKPAYMSKYPPAQGVVLAAGEGLGHPWIGVLLSVAVMCAAVTWMMQQRLPPQWALLGGLLVVVRFAAFNYWIDSYWGGAVAAIGGALAMGAWRRLSRSPRVTHALVLGLGLAILANSRPVEGIIFCLPLAVAFEFWLFQGNLRAQKLWKAAMPMAVVLLAIFGFFAYYNWRGTGDWRLPPYVAYQRAHFASPPLLVQSLPPAADFGNQQFTDYSNEQRAEYREHRARVGALVWSRARDLASFFYGPLVLAPLLALPWLVWDRRIRLLLVQLLISFCGLVMVSAFFFHYAAPLTATFFCLAMQGLRHVRQWRIAGRRVGVALTGLIVLVSVAALPAHIAKRWYEQRKGVEWGDRSMEARARIARKLQIQAGPQLVLVQYSADHDVHEEWVYNAADIDHAKIVWAREIPGMDLKPLLDYFHDRTVSEVEPDRPRIELHAYRGVP